MHIKRFEAATVQEALTRIRSELGPNALILETHRSTDGSGWVEVTAALPQEEPETVEARARQAYGAAASPVARPKTAPTPWASAARPPVRPEDPTEASRPEVQIGGMSRAGIGSKVADILSRLPRENVASALTPEQRRRFLGETAIPPGRGDALPPGRGDAPPSDRGDAPPSDRGPVLTTGRGGALPPRSDRGPVLTTGRGAALPEHPARDEAFAGPETGSRVDAGATELQRLRERNEYLGRLVRSEHFSLIPLPLRDLYLDLSEAEVDANLTFQILSRMGEAPMRGRFQPVPLGEVLPRLESMVSVGGDVKPADGRRVIALVGPTGVGKTTTLAKIAGQVAFGQQKRVALISTDAYRIFGAQHLGSYATLMDLPFATAATSAEIRQLLEVDFADCDVVLIDTSGRSPRDPEGIEEIHQILGACPEADIQLVLAANARVRDMAFALEGFSRLPIRHLVFTKLDETTRRGGLFTVALKARRPVAYLGTGQEVPDDLHVATARVLTEGIAQMEDRHVA